MWLDKRTKDLDRQRAELIEQWKAEAKAEEEAVKRDYESSRWCSALFYCIDGRCGGCLQKVYKFLLWLETFIANLPLTIGAIALALANLGVVVSMYSTLMHYLRSVVVVVVVVVVCRLVFLADDCVSSPVQSFIFHPLTVSL
jgi:hypothetical protein